MEKPPARPNHAPERVFLALGSNIGNREANLRMALRLLAASCRVINVSSLYRSRAVVPEGDPPGPDYLNAVCEIHTDLSPEELLRFVKGIEHEIGRRPAGRWAPRPIDIDILLYGARLIESEHLVVPHPRMAERAFVLAPLSELAPGLLHPAAGRAIAELAAAADTDGPQRVEGPAWARARAGA